MRSAKDDYRQQGLRKKLVDTIRAKGINNEKVLQAIGSVPRHFFLDSAFEEASYEDKAFPIGEGQTISQPYTVAYQTQLLELDKPYLKVLEIGTGSAYQAVILAELGAMVYTIERQKKLFDSNREFPLLKKYHSLKMFYGDGFEGLPTYGPFDRIIITAAADKMPDKLVAQLKTGGKMVIPFGDHDKFQQMLRLTKQADGSLTEERFEEFSFVPMLGGKSK